MKTMTIVCDQCQHDLTKTDNCEGYRVLLCSEEIPSKGGCVTAMAACYPCFETAKHFCDSRCLKKWIDDNLIDDKRQSFG